MIEIFEGLIGGGKSYSAVLRIERQLASGGLYIGNIKINMETMRRRLWKRYKWTLHDDQVIQLDEHEVGAFHEYCPHGTTEKPVLVVIDEAHLWLNSREWSKANKDLLKFLTQSRKVSIDIIFISQHCKNVDSQIMRLVAWRWRMRDMSNWSLPGLGMRWPLQQILQSRYDNTDTYIDRNWLWKDKGIFALYDTTDLLVGFQMAEGVRTDFTAKKRKAGKQIKAIKWAKDYGGWIVVCLLILWAGAGCVHMTRKVKGFLGGTPMKASDLEEVKDIEIPKGEKRKEEKEVAAVVEAEREWSVETEWHNFEAHMVWARGPVVSVGGRLYEGGKFYRAGRCVVLEPERLVFLDGKRVTVWRDEKPIERPERVQSVRDILVSKKVLERY